MAGTLAISGEVNCPEHGHLIEIEGYCLGGCEHFKGLMVNTDQDNDGWLYAAIVCELATPPKEPESHRR